MELDYKLPSYCVQIQQYYLFNSSKIPSHIGAKFSCLQWKKIRQNLHVNPKYKECVSLLKCNHGNSFGRKIITKLAFNLFPLSLEYKRIGRTPRRSRLLRVVHAWERVEYSSPARVCHGIWSTCANVDIAHSSRVNTITIAHSILKSTQLAVFNHSEQTTLGYGRARFGARWSFLEHSRNRKSGSVIGLFCKTVITHNDTLVTCFWHAVWCSCTSDIPVSLPIFYFGPFKSERLAYGTTITCWYWILGTWCLDYCCIWRFMELWSKVCS